MPLGGMDLNEGYVTWAREHLGAEVDLASLPAKIHPSWDAVLSCYTLAYCIPSEVVETIRGIENRILILMEPWGNGQCLKLPSYTCPRFYHPWGEITSALGWKMIWRWPIPQIDSLDSLAIFSKQ